MGVGCCMGPARLATILFLAGTVITGTPDLPAADKNTMKDALSHYGKGQAYEEKGRPDLAVKEYRKALYLVPDEAYLHSALGEGLEKLGDVRAALEEYNKARHYSPLDSALSEKCEELAGTFGPTEAGGKQPVRSEAASTTAFAVGGDVRAPEPIYKPEPPYSVEARQAKYVAMCVLSIVIDERGMVSDTRVVKPAFFGLAQRTLATVRTWKFKPATRNGVPVPVRVLVEVTFRLW